MEQNAAVTLLERHYSTIGIDDVFLNAVGPSILPLENECDRDAPETAEVSQSDENHQHHHQWWLPSVYFVQEFRWKDPVLLWELIGDIKSQPEDFIVREISADNQQVADLKLDSDFIHHKDEDLSTKKHGKIPQHVQETSSPSDSKHSIPVKNTEIISEVRNPPYKKHTVTSPLELDPLQCLKEILQNKLEDKTNVDFVLKELYDLNQRVLSSLSTKATHDNCCDSSAATTVPPENKTKEDVRFVLQQRSASLQDSTTTQPAKEERAEIHEAIRFAYPILKSEIVQQDESLTYQIRVFPEQYFSSLALYLSHPNEDLPLLYAYYKLGYEYAERQQKQRFGKRTKHRGGQLTQLDGVTLRLRPDLSKTERRNIHQIIEAKTKGMLGTQTIQNNTNKDGLDSNNVSIFVQWTKVARRKVTKKRKRDPLSESTTKQNQSYTLCVVRKRKAEHIAMIQMLSTCLRCRPAEIGFAGIKDMHAITYQFCTFEKVGFQRILAAQDRLNQRGISVQPLRMVNHSLRKGDLVGNRFNIVVRNMRQVQVQYTSNKGIQEAFVPANKTHIHDMAGRIRSFGFVNFYGEQRVGDAGSAVMVGVRAVDIGRAILQGEYSKAIDYILTGRRTSEAANGDSDDFIRFRQAWITTKDPDAALKALPSGGLPRERALLRGLKRYGSENPRAVLQCLQHNDRVFYVNAVSVCTFESTYPPQAHTRFCFLYLLSVPIVCVEHNGVEKIARIWNQSCPGRFSSWWRTWRHLESRTR
jgi:TruD family tRNA pseudouridine synthase